MLKLTFFLQLANLYYWVSSGTSSLVHGVDVYSRAKAIDKHKNLENLVENTYPDSITDIDSRKSPINERILVKESSVEHLLQQYYKSEQQKLSSQARRKEMIDLFGIEPEEVIEVLRPEEERSGSNRLLGAPLSDLDSYWSLYILSNRKNSNDRGKVIIPYDFDKDTVSRSTRETVQDVIKRFNSKSRSVKFRLRSKLSSQLRSQFQLARRKRRKIGNDQYSFTPMLTRKQEAKLVEVEHYILFTSKFPSTCSSFVGMQRRLTNGQRLNLGNGCVNTGSILHELLHAAGMWHENQLPEASKYIQVIWENILDEKQNSFVSKNLESTSLGLRYDFQSIMHYASNEFGKPEFSCVSREYCSPVRLEYPTDFGGKFCLEVLEIDPNKIEEEQQEYILNYKFCEDTPIIADERDTAREENEVLFHLEPGQTLFAGLADTTSLVLRYYKNPLYCLFKDKGGSTDLLSNSGGGVRLVKCPQPYTQEVADESFYTNEYLHYQRFLFIHERDERQPRLSRLLYQGNPSQCLTRELQTEFQVGLQFSRCTYLKDYQQHWQLVMMNSPHHQSKNSGHETRRSLGRRGKNHHTEQGKDLVEEESGNDVEEDSTTSTTDPQLDFWFDEQYPTTCTQVEVECSTTGQKQKTIQSEKLIGQRFGLTRSDRFELELMYRHYTCPEVRNPKPRGVMIFCTEKCPCFQGEGHCRKDSECEAGLRCSKTDTVIESTQEDTSGDDTNVDLDPDVLKIYDEEDGKKDDFPTSTAYDEDRVVEDQSMSPWEGEVLEASVDAQSSSMMADEEEDIWEAEEKEALRQGLEPYGNIRDFVQNPQEVNICVKAKDIKTCPPRCASLVSDGICDPECGFQCDRVDCVCQQTTYKCRCVLTAMCARCNTILGREQCTNTKGCEYAKPLFCPLPFPPP